VRAASVIGTMRTVAELKLKLNVIGVVATCENMRRHRLPPGDIVTSMSGQTIEILNTMRGTLILCDALTYVERFKPARLSTLPPDRACVIALGNVNSGLFANNDELAEELLAPAAALAMPPGTCRWAMNTRSS